MDELLEELKDSCQECIMLHHGMGVEEIADIMMRQYLAEVTDVFGTNERKSRKKLVELLNRIYVIEEFT